MEKQKSGFLIRNFKFENEKITKWSDTSKSKSIQYKFDIKTPKLTPLNPNEGLLQFIFKVQILPDIGEVSFNGDCILFSTNLKLIIFILSNEKSKLRKKNEHFITYLNKLLLRKCMDYAKEIGEKNGVHFHGYDYFLKKEGIDQITFQKHKPSKILKPEGGKLVPKQTGLKLPKDVKNLIGFKDFKFKNEKTTLGKNAGKERYDATFDVQPMLYKPKLINSRTAEVIFHFHLEISPDICIIDFDGECTADSLVTRITDLLKNDKDKLVMILRAAIISESLKHAKELAYPDVTFDIDEVIKKLKLIK